MKDVSSKVAKAFTDLIINKKKAISIMGLGRFCT